MHKEEGSAFNVTLPPQKKPTLVCIPCICLSTLCKVTQMCHGHSLDCKEAKYDLIRTFKGERNQLMNYPAAHPSTSPVTFEWSAVRKCSQRSFRVAGWTDGDAPPLCVALDFISLTQPQGCAPIEAPLLFFFLFLKSSVRHCVCVCVSVRWRMLVCVCVCGHACGPVCGF